MTSEGAAFVLGMAVMFAMMLPALAVLFSHTIELDDRDRKERLAQHDKEANRG